MFKEIIDSLKIEPALKLSGPDLFELYQKFDEGVCLRVKMGFEPVGKPVVNYDPHTNVYNITQDFSVDKDSLHAKNKTKVKWIVNEDDIIHDKMPQWIREFRYVGHYCIISLSNGCVYRGKIPHSISKEEDQFFAYFFDEDEKNEN